MIFEVRIAGGNSWAEFIVELFPNTNNEIKIELLDKAGENPRHSGYSSDYFEAGIYRGVRDLINQMNSLGIGISGIDFKITNLSYHAIDSKPGAFTYPFLELMNRLINSDYFGMSADNVTNESVFYTLNIMKRDSYKEYYLLKENQFQLVSPKRYTNTLNLNNRVEILIKDIEHEIDRWRVTLSPKHYNKGISKRYTIDFEFRDQFSDLRKYKTINTILHIYQQVNHVIEEFQIRKINVSGFFLLIEPLYNSEAEYVNSNFEHIKWAIFSALLDKNLTQTINENL